MGSQPTANACSAVGNLDGERTMIRFNPGISLTGPVAMADPALSGLNSFAPGANCFPAPGKARGIAAGTEFGD